MTNTAEYVAQAIQMNCADLGSDSEVELMDGLDISVFGADKAKEVRYLICTSTMGLAMCQTMCGRFSTHWTSNHGFWAMSVMA